MENFAFHHVGTAVRNLAKAIPIYKNLLGYELKSGPFDDPIQNVSVCFLSRGDGDTVIELVAPLGPNSPVDLALKSFLLSSPVPAVAFEMREIAWLVTEVELLVELVQA